MIAGLYELHIIKINIKNRVYNYYFDNLIKAKKKKGTKNILIFYKKSFNDVKNFKSALS